MRVWAFPWIYPYDRPGMKYSGIFVHRQYKGLIECGADLTVIIPVPWHPPYPLSQLHNEWKRYKELDFPNQREYDGIKVYYPRIANMRPSRFVKKPYTERYIESIVNFFKNHNIKLDPATDIFYSQWLPGSALVQLAAHKLGVKSAVSGIGDDIIVWPHDSKEAFCTFEKLLLVADLRIVNADYLGKEMNKLTGRNLNYHVIYFGIDHAVFKPATTENIKAIRKEYNIPDNKVIVLTIGSALKRKGWLDLFDALKEVKKENDNFLLIGCYGEPSDIDIVAEVETRGLTSYFINVGEIKPEALSGLYNTADIFCLPSHWEGLATVISEAMASGLPVITTDMCGHPEIIENNVTGVLIPAKQPVMLSKELLVLINSKEKRDYLGKNARDFIVDKFGSYIDNAAQLYKIMAALLLKK